LSIEHHNKGTAFCAYRSQQTQIFFADMEILSEVRATRHLEKDCWIAFEPVHSLDRHYGVTFKLTIYIQPRQNLISAAYLTQHEEVQTLHFFTRPRRFA
jgi:hypothetical protein